MSPPRTLYDTLKLEPHCCAAMIGSQRRKQLFALHPDRTKLEKKFTPQVLADIRALIDGAYEILSDESSRQRYDQLLRTGIYTKPHGGMQTNFEELKQFIEQMPLQRENTARRRHAPASNYHTDSSSEEQDDDPKEKPPSFASNLRGMYSRWGTCL